MAFTDLRKMLECSICLDVYTDPVMLKCGHNFCQECIHEVLDAQEVYAREQDSSDGDQVLDAQDLYASGQDLSDGDQVDAEIYSCPECREEFRERPSLSRNIVLQNIMETFLFTESHQGDIGTPCTYCVEAPVSAVKSCLLCEASLCDKHLRCHSKSPGHVMADPNASVEKMSCSVHKKILEYYCTEEEACICVYCSAEEHRNHKVVSLDEASENKKRELQEVLLKIASKRDEIEGSVGGLQECRKKLEEFISLKRKWVVTLFVDIRRQLEELEKKVLGEISWRVEQVDLAFSDQIKWMEIEIEELSKKMRHIEELCDTADPLTVLQESDCGDMCETKDGGVMADPLTILQESDCGNTCEDGGDTADPLTVLQESDCGDMCETKDGGDTADPLTILQESDCGNTCETLDGGDTADQLTILQESDCGDTCKTKEGDNKRHLFDEKVLDMTKMSHILHTGLSDIIMGLHRGVVLPAASELSLDVKTAHNFLYISDNGKMAVAIDLPPQHPKTAERFKDYAQVLSRERFDLGRHFWDLSIVESYRWRVGVCYPSMVRKGRPSWLGYNEKSWCLEKRNDQFSVIHDSQVVQIPATVTSNKVRIYLDYEAGRLSFYDMCHPMRHIYTFNVAFTEPLHAAFALWEGGCMELSGAIQDG